MGVGWLRSHPPRLIVSHWPLRVSHLAVTSWGGGVALDGRLSHQMLSHSGLGHRERRDPVGEVTGRRLREPRVGCRWVKGG